MTVAVETIEAPAGPAKDPAGVRWLIFARDRGILVLWVLLLAGFGVWASPYFASLDNAILIANAAALTAIFAAGIAVGVICGALDLSIPGTAAMAGCVCGWLMTHGLPVWLGILAGLAVGVVVGLTFLGTDRLAGLPAPVWVVAALFLAGTTFLTRTRHGIRLMAVGGNAEAVRRSGIDADRYKVLGFVVSGFCAALGGLVTAALVTEANPAANPGIIFNALTAVALAGVSLSGGRGSLPRVLVGALILGTISNGLTIKGIEPYWATAVTGLLLLASLGLEKRVSTTVSRRLVEKERSGPR
jgi:ribose transport system permease protein